MWCVEMECVGLLTGAVRAGIVAVHRMQLPSVTQARKASTSLATLAEVLEAVAPDVMKYAKLLQKHGEAALNRSKPDIAMKEHVRPPPTSTSSLSTP
jgi:hypothetical protein